ncbi:MAG: HlyD family secretion protein, partial [Muribaculaceae bacterium]|nr:HlyD family secretion protein [Muribaculaceae bacterium]
KNIAVGAPVEIEVDAIPGVKFEGEVESISSATGGALSPLPHDNSSGNFVKVRQRVPVRIRFSNSNPADEMSKLRAGMNAECVIK